MKDYKDFKTEIIEISAIIDKYPEALRSRVFDLLVNGFINGNMGASPQEKRNEKNEAEAENADGQGKAAVAKGSSKKSNLESYTIDRNLNLRGGTDIPSFKSFYAEKQPTSKAEFNAVSIYYLKKIMNIQQVTLDQVYTCYKEVNLKPADHFKQSFRDTKNVQGYIEYDDDWNMIIPHRGVTFVEHDLPRKITKKK